MSNMGEIADFESKAFSALSETVHKETGLVLLPEKFLMIKSRLRPRLKRLGMNSLEQYQKYVCSPSGRDERRQMISALTTNVSHFFRESHHFDILRERFGIWRSKKSKIRIWSAGCSNGQEAVSIAASVLPLLSNSDEIDLRVLATDIDQEVVSFARNSTYSENMLSGIDDEKIANIFEPRRDKDGSYVIKEKIRNLIYFNELNLLSKWPMTGRFDAIFCRNVVIYFDLETQESLWPRFHESLEPGGLFFLGHSERIVDPDKFGFSPVGPTAYEKV